MLLEKSLHKPSLGALSTRQDAFSKKYFVRYWTLTLHQLQPDPLPHSTQQPVSLFTHLTPLFASYLHYLISSFNRPSQCQELFLCLKTLPALAVWSPLLLNLGSPGLQNISPELRCWDKARGEGGWVPREVCIRRSERTLPTLAFKTPIEAVCMSTQVGFKVCKKKKKKMQHWPSA